MKYKKSMIVIMLTIFLFAIAAASASDVNETVMANEDTGQLELSVNDETLSSETNPEILADGQYTYSDLRDQIGSGGNINLTKGTYTYNNDGDTIEITTSGVIDGNGAVIDMAGFNKQAFKVTTFGVTIKNLTIKNANFDGAGGAISFSGMGTVENCNFIGNKANNNKGGAVSFDMYGTGRVKNCNFTNNSAFYGGAINIYDGFIENCIFCGHKGTEGGAISIGFGTVTNCNFTDNKATGDYGHGGAVYFNRDGTVTNCNFTNNTAGDSGGAVYFYKNGDVTNCNFTNNKATGDYGHGGAISTGFGTVTNCNFTDNNATNGGAIWMYSGSVENCNFTNNAASLDGGAIDFDGTGTVTNCNFTDNKATGDESCGGAVYFNKNVEGNVTDCSFTNNSATKNGGVIYLDKGSTGRIINCNFTDNSASGGGAIYFLYRSTGTVANCNFANNAASNGGAVCFDMTSGRVINCNFTDNKASLYGGAVRFSSGTVTNCNFADNYACYGGAISTGFGTVTNCNFTNNSATSEGGAVRFSGPGMVTNCNFTHNKATGDDSCGGAVYFSGEFSTVTDSNFTDNTATTGGAIWMFSGNVTNCNFTNNNANRGGAVYFLEDSKVTDCNFTNNSAAGDGGAVCFNENGTVTNCNFTDNSAKYGGAILFDGIHVSAVENCNFVNNNASFEAGAIDFEGSGAVTNCNFTNNYGLFAGAVLFEGTGVVKDCVFVNNSADSQGGAIRFTTTDLKNTGTVINCNFTDNSADSQGGAVFFNINGTVTDCNFVNNSAMFGGAIRFWGTCNITDCNFTGNNGSIGSAIYFMSNLGTRTISNSLFLNNKADAYTPPFQILEKDNKTEITFMGQNNLLNAIYSPGEINLTNVVYWGAKGITNTDDTYPSRSDREAGQNVTVIGFVNDHIINTTKTTDADGKIVLEETIIGDYLISVRHDEDSYYREAETIITNMQFFYVNVTSMTTDNKTVNITAKSNIRNEVIRGKLVFILPNGTEINANYAGNGTWWALHTFDDCGDYEVNATYSGLDNVTINNATISVRLKTELSANDVTATYNIIKELIITLKDGTGKAISGVNVTVDLNGAKTYTTDGNGQVKISTKGLAPKTYAVKITFNGNNFYYKSVKDVKVTVKKATPKITAKKKTFKTTVKTKKYTITLKDNTGKAIKKAKVTLKVKGKTYKATTNSKGKATFKITKLNKKGTFKAVIKYKGNKYYNKLTKKAKIKVIVTFKTVSRGSKDKSTVKEIQQALKDNGYYLTYKGHYLMVDGKYNSCTVRSVKEFQHDKGLKVTGKVDEKTAKKLKII